MPDPVYTPLTVLGPLAPFSGVNAKALFEHPTVTDGNKFVNVRGKTHLFIFNNGASTISLTFDLTAAVSDTYGGSLPVTDKSVSIGAGEAKILGPFSANAETSGYVNIIWTLGTVAAEDVDVLAFKTQ